MKGVSARTYNTRAALCSLAFARFFRYNELCNIAPNHIEFHSQYIKIFVPRSKTDI